MIEYIANKKTKLVEIKNVVRVKLHILTKKYKY